MATAANAALMTTAALRWLPPIGTALLHHGFALLLLLDSLRFESLDAPPHRPAAAPRGLAKITRGAPPAETETPRSETA